MKTKLGITFMVFGTVLVALALGLFLRNEQEQHQAGEMVVALMPQVAQAIRENQEAPPENTPAPAADVPGAAAPVLLKKELPKVEIDGNGYIGFVGFPTLQQELPVMADWDYTKLKTAPCRYAGDTSSDDLVIMAHNYVSHFGSLHKLRVGDSVTFTDMNGVTTEYVVVAMDVLASTAVDEMTAGEYDLTLFTCNYSGQSRVTVRCDRVET